MVILKGHCRQSDIVEFTLDVIMDGRRSFGTNEVGTTSLQLAWAQGQKKYVRTRDYSPKWSGLLVT